MSESVFSKIIKGEIPAYKVYEDDLTYAFLDVRPLTPGHVLIVTKQQVDHLWDLDDEYYQQLMDATKKVALRIREVLQPPRVGMNVEGFGVAHIHVHVYPLYKGLESTMADYLSKPKQTVANEELTEMAKKLRF